MAARGWEGDDADAGFTAAHRGNGSISGVERTDTQRAADGDGAGVQTNESTEKQPLKSTKRKRNLLGESQLLSQEGFKKIYQTFPYQTSGGVAGQEAKALNSLIKMYKQWAYDLYPSLNFEDFIDRAEALGKTHGVQGLMSDLRSKEMRRVLGIPEDDSHLPTEEGLSGEQSQEADADPEESGFIVPGGDQEDDAEAYYSEEEAML